MVIEEYLNSIPNVIYTNDELKVLDDRIISGDDKARNDYVIGNLRLVVYYALRYRSNSIDVMDLISCGNEGLVKASRFYDPRRGVKFSTYATYWIIRKMQCAISINKYGFKISDEMKKKAEEILDICNDYYMMNGCNPSIKQLSSMTGLSIKRINYIFLKMGDVVSLDQSIGDDNDMYDVLSDGSNDIESYCSLKIDISRALSMLDDGELLLLSHLYGLNGLDVKTEKQVGEILGISHQRVSQKKQKVLLKLRKKFTCKIYTE